MNFNEILYTALSEHCLLSRASDKVKVNDVDELRQRIQSPDCSAWDELDQRIIDNATKDCSGSPA